MTYSKQEIVIVLLELAKQHKPLISMTPLIDVVFILLLFFMLSSTFNRTKQIEVKAAAAGKQQQSNQFNKMLLHSGDRVTVNNDSYLIESSEFVSLLNKLASAGDKVTLAATSQVKVQKIIQLLDQVRSAGIRNLSLSQSVTP